MGFRRCGFEQADASCSEEDADFGYDQAAEHALNVFVTLNQDDLDATAFSMVRQLSAVAEIPLGHGTDLTQLDKLVARRSKTTQQATEIDKVLRGKQRQ